MTAALPAEMHPVEPAAVTTDYRAVKPDGLARPAGDDVAQGGEIEGTVRWGALQCAAPKIG